jgi:hypothetical protein
VKDEPKKNPFATSKPRSEWKRPAKRCRGRLLHDVQVGPNPSDTALFVFELKSDGLHVRRKGGWKSRAKVWKFESLANGVAPGQAQMKLL